MNKAKLRGQMIKKFKKVQVSHEGTGGGGAECVPWDIPTKAGFLPRKRASLCKLHE